jgi:hypothetical protein
MGGCYFRLLNTKNTKVNEKSTGSNFGSLNVIAYAKEAF